MRSRAYRATAVKRVDWEALIAGRDGHAVQVGLDIGKEDVLAVLRWDAEHFERPWLVKNPQEVAELISLLKRVGKDRVLRLAMEPTGTYGDVLRQAIADAGWHLDRVSTKASHDYAEVFDGVPSQHDGKDAAIVADLAAMGKCNEWPYEAQSVTEQEMAYWVDWMDAHQRQYVMWLGRLEALVSRHWPEARQWLGLSSGTLLRVLQHYGGPAGLAVDTGAVERLLRWGGPYLKAAKVRGLIDSARNSVGVRQGAIDVHRMQEYAGQALTARGEIAKSKRCLEKLAYGHDVIQSQAKAVGIATACVLWVHLGPPLAYHCGEAYRKAMGLNLAERSSGMYKGKLKISKRGFGQVRRWLYFAALRCVAQSPVRRWYQRKKAKDGEGAKRAMIGVMRKLALALYAVGAQGATFEARRLFPGRPVGQPRREKRASALRR